MEKCVLRPIYHVRLTIDSACKAQHVVRLVHAVSLHVCPES
jgi:hypothetical protein